jgi:phosphoribosylformylglycinamidine synthase
MADPQSLRPPRAPGTNCDIETAWAFELAGALARTAASEPTAGKPGSDWPNIQILCIPGGFSYGDDLGGRHHLLPAAPAVS